MTRISGPAEVATFDGGDSALYTKDSIFARAWAVRVAGEHRRADTKREVERCHLEWRGAQS